jgi:hypothetical protein
MSYSEELINSKPKIDRIVHYTDFKSALKIIKFCSFKTTNPIKFNDPFECMPRIKKLSEYSDGELDSLLNQHIEANTDLFKAGMDQLKRSGSSEKFLEYSKRQIDPERINFQETMGRYFRLASCGRNPNIIPMWAHYSENHTGVVFEFDPNAMPFSGLLEIDAIVPVKYSKERVYYDHLKSELDHHQGRFTEIATTKDSSWSYEDEIRMILPRDASEGGLEEHFFCRKDDLFLKLQPSSVKTIYCGMRMSAKNQKKLESFVRTYFKGHLVKIIKVVLADERYGFHPFET